MLVSGPLGAFENQTWRPGAESTDTCLIDRTSQGALIMVQLGPPSSLRLTGIEQ